LPLGESARHCRGPHRDPPSSGTDSAREATKSTGGLPIPGKEASGRVPYAADRGSSVAKRVLYDTGRVSRAPRRRSARHRARQGDAPARLVRREPPFASNEARPVGDESPSASDETRPVGDESPFASDETRLVRDGRRLVCRALGFGARRPHLIGDESPLERYQPPSVPFESPSESCEPVPGAKRCGSITGDLRLMRGSLRRRSRQGSAQIRHEGLDLRRSTQLSAVDSVDRHGRQ
jgi:hypothetical protein